MRFSRTWEVALILGALATTSVADVVTLNDGSKLLGTVQRLQDGKLTLETKFAGTLEIDASLVETIATDEPVNVEVNTGDRLVGPIEWKPEVNTAIVETQLGGVPVSVERIDAIWPKGGKSPELTAMEQQIEQVKKEMEKARGKWGLHVEFGLLAQEGNTKKFQAIGGIEGRRTTERDLLRLYVTADYATENRVRNSNEVIGGAYYEYLITKRFFAYGRTELEYDEFENIELRATVAGGVGYYWIKQEKQELKTRGGIGYLHESYLDDTEAKNTAQAELALDYRLDINSWLRFQHAMAYYPTFKSVRDYRLTSDTALIFKLTDDRLVNLKIGAKYDYDAIPTGNAERLDQTYYANILVNIE